MRSFEDVELEVVFFEVKASIVTSGNICYGAEFNNMIGWTLKAYEC